MVATVLAATSSPVLVSRQVAGRKAINGVSGSGCSIVLRPAVIQLTNPDFLVRNAVLPVQRRTVCRVSRTVMARYTADLVWRLSHGISSAKCYLQGLINVRCMQQQSAETVPAPSRRHNRCSSSNGEPSHGRGRSDPISEELVVLCCCWRHNRSSNRNSRHWRIQLRPYQAWKQIELSANFFAIQPFLGRTFALYFKPLSASHGNTCWGWQF